MRPLKRLNRISCVMRAKLLRGAWKKPGRMRGRAWMKRAAGCSGRGPRHLALALLERPRGIGPLHHLRHLEQVLRAGRSLRLRVADVEVRNELVLARAEERRVRHARDL